MLNWTSEKPLFSRLLYPWHRPRLFFVFFSLLLLLSLGEKPRGASHLAYFNSIYVRSQPSSKRLWHYAFALSYAHRPKVASCSSFKQKNRSNRQMQHVLSSLYFLMRQWKSPLNLWRINLYTICQRWILLLG